MSERDSFIDEVTEEVRKDRLYAIWKKHGPYLIGGLVLIVIGIGIMTYLQVHKERSMRAAGSALIETQSIESPADRASALEELAGESGPARSTIAHLSAAGAHLEAGAPDQALGIYETLMNDRETPLVLQEFAQLRAAMIRLDYDMIEDQADIVASLNTLATSSDWGPLAQEVLAAIQFKDGDNEAVIKTLESIIESENTPLQLRIRSQRMLDALKPE